MTALPLAGLWHSIDGHRYQSKTIRNFVSGDPQPSIVEGTVDRPVVLRRQPSAAQSWRTERSPWQTQLEVRLDRMRSGRDWATVSGRVLVVVDGRCDQLGPGDSIAVYGSIEAFSGPSNPGAEDFRPIFRRRNLHARMRVESPDQIVLRHRSSQRPERLIAAIARSARQRLLRHTGEESGPLAIALVIGQREFVDPAQWDRLMVTGTVHLLSVSGLHLAIMMTLAHWMATLMRFPPTAKAVWVISICLLYTAVTGGRPPVVRAAILVITFVVAHLIQRPSQPINTLSLAGLIILVWNPAVIFGIGTQLSFLAVATLLLCRPGSINPAAAAIDSVEQEDRLRVLVEQSRWKTIIMARQTIRLIGRALWYSGCVTAVSLPLVWYHFHIVSPISIATNVLLSPILFIALASGVATAVFGGFEPLGWTCGAVCDRSISAMTWIIDRAVEFPGGHWWLPSPPASWVATFYVVLLVSLYLPTNKVVSSLRYMWIGLWIPVAWLMATSVIPVDSGSIEATFIDVGHGTCVVLRSGDAVWLYDCGRLGNDTGLSRDIDATLWSLGVTHLDGIYLSHADADHFNALPGVLQRFRVAQIVTPPGMFDSHEPAVARIRQVIETAAIPLREVAQGEVGWIGHHSVTVLHPPTERILGTDNANSLVLLINRDGRNLILPGDLEPPGTARLIDHPRPPAGGVLMAPHHGSLRMDAEAVLQWARPSQTVVSGGRRAKRPEVAEMLSATGSGVHVSSQVGAIRVIIDRAGEIEICSWASNPW